MSTTAQLLGRQVSLTANSPGTPGIDAQLVTSPQGTHCATWPPADTGPSHARGEDPRWAEKLRRRQMLRRHADRRHYYRLVKREYNKARSEWGKLGERQRH